ncbi:hypothetical protein [Paracidovorax cattleyae]|uniref:hypothetical protein n=1 Tax=Paracidovorax cattleyae TaxID=80868 RepID=UPI0018AFABF2|nr:hypothetical protein [Paracidovorax cattleyae]MBF9264126.1 hypothetical protein [Paracidovorax cattleyae]
MNSRKEDQRRNGMPWTRDAYQLKMGLCTALLMLGLVGCERPPEPSCRETVQVFELNGQQVLQAVNGVYLRKDFNVRGCSAETNSREGRVKRFVAWGADRFYWYEGRLVSVSEYSELVKKGLWPQEVQPDIYIMMKFGPNQPVNDADREKPWWFKPALPHKIYPIDLLPNFALEIPDPEAGHGPIKSKPSAYWAVRGTEDFETKKPYVTFCSIKPPEGKPGNDVSHQRDVRWLINGKTYEDNYVGNTCRGNASADNGKNIYAMVDVPGAALKDIDKIYKAVAAHLSEMTVE